MPGTVTVASKLPHPIILQLQRPIKHNEAVMGGGFREVTRHERYGKTITIKGIAKFNASVEPNQPMSHGFALTHDVDADFFREWVQQNVELDAIKNGLIYASEKRPDVIAHSREYESARTGLEAANPNDLPPEFKRKISTDTERSRQRGSAYDG